MSSWHGICCLPSTRRAYDLNINSLVHIPHHVSGSLALLLACLFCRVIWLTALVLVVEDRRERERKEEREVGMRRESRFMMESGRITDNMGLESGDTGLE